MKKTNYRDLEVYKLSFELFIKIHTFSQSLPRQEQFELGNQMRRSADSVVTNIVEGYGRRMYKKEFVKFLIYSKSSVDETICHLEKLELLYPGLIKQIKIFISSYQRLGVMLHSFLNYVINQWNSFKN